MIMCRKYALLLILHPRSVRGGGGMGQVCTGCIPEAEVSNVTW